MLFSELSQIIDGKPAISHDCEVQTFSTDTRTLSGRSQEVFVAIQGKRDGHDFIGEASAKGVKNFLIEKEVNIPEANTVLVENSLVAFQKIATHHRQKFNIPIVGITGSNGKTTVKEWLSVLLSSSCFVIKNPKSFNSQIGVPLSVLEIQNIHEVGVFEAGISQVAEMGNLEKIIQPSLGIFTTLGSAHAEGFSDDQEKLKEKLLLFQNSEKVIYRNDASYSSLITEALEEKGTTWSLNGNSAYRVQWDEGTIRINGATYHTNLRTETELENVTHAIVGALELQLTKEAIQEGLKLIEPLPMRLALKKGINDCFILDDSYNNDLQGLKVAIDYLESHKQKQKKTLILSDILQSGRDDMTLYRQVNELLLDHKIHRLLGVGPRISKCSEIFRVEKEFFDSTEDLLQHLPEFKQEMVIVKGARDFGLERVARRLEERTHGTILEVNFESLQHNLTQYRNLLSPTTQMMVMVKANAYGSGVLEVANFLQHQRVDRLGVAYVDEAILLRKHGIEIPIMIMNPDIRSFHDFEKYQLEAEIYSISHLDHFLTSVSGYPSIHLKIDTGMHRLGFSEADLPALMERLQAHPSLKVVGIFTHFSGSDNGEHDAFTREQAGRFEKLYQALAESLGYLPLKHACNSSGIVRWPEYHFDMVRLGIGLHGFDPTNTLNLRKTSQLKSTISQIRSLTPGETIGYSRKGQVTRDSQIAILPIGYEDGFLRMFGNGKAKVFCGGQLCPTIGNVCMDMLMVDVTGASVQEGDEAIIFGDIPTIQDLAEWADTIPYEILTNVSGRVKRIFVWE